MVGALAVLVSVGFPICPSAALFRQPCPGCGLTRATLALLHGDLGAAMALNPAAPIAAPITLVVLGWMAVRYVRSARTGLPGWVAWPVALAGVLLLVVWAARMLGAWGGPVPV